MAGWPRGFPLFLSSSMRTNKIKQKKKKREREGKRDQNTRFSGVPPIPSTQLQIQTGVSMPTAAWGGGFGSLCGPLFVWNLVRTLTFQRRACRFSFLFFRGFPACSPSLQRSFRFKPSRLRPLLLGGVVLGPYAGPCVFRTKSETWNLPSGQLRCYSCACKFDNAIYTPSETHYSFGGLSGPAHPGAWECRGCLLFSLIGKPKTF